MSIKEERINRVKAFYYSNPKIGEAMAAFSGGREVVPQYFEGFGKRPDVVQYGADILGAVRKGATSFHASEEIWSDPMGLSSEITLREMNSLRKGWDLLIDIDSPFLDCSKIAARLLIAALENHGVGNYGIKFSGSKGFHIIVGWEAFPKEFDGVATKEMFPEWPRAICSYLMEFIRREYNKQARSVLTDFAAIEKRTKLSREKLEETRCRICERPALKGNIVNLICPVCGMKIERKNMKITKKRLKCLNVDCAGVLEVVDSKEFEYCENCKDPENENLQLNSDKHPGEFEKAEGVSAEKVASLDLVLVAPRHLFRMPYSLHEKTGLASVVLGKEEIDGFSPKDADPMNVKIKDFMPKNFEGEASKLLMEALEWKKGRDVVDEKIGAGRYKGVKGDKKYDDFEFKDVGDDVFPAPIKKLLGGLDEGRKRGLFVLLTFLKSLNFSPEEINKRVREWNERNDPPLKEGYVRSQIDWHLKQRKKIMPPNYSNDAFYSDIGLVKGKQKNKNPLVDVKKELWKRGNRLC